MILIVSFIGKISYLYLLEQISWNYVDKTFWGIFGG
jgi:hypothetical protein